MRSGLLIFAVREAEGERDGWMEWREGESKADRYEGEQEVELRHAP